MTTLWRMWTAWHRTCEDRLPAWLLPLTLGCAVLAVAMAVVAVRDTTSWRTK